MDGVYDVGACRLCLVEVAGIPKLLPACTTRVTEGMEVETDSERLRKYRRMTLELLFAERNHVCAVCVANGHCEFQTLACTPGMDHVRFDYTFPKWEVDNTHPRYGMDHNRCMLCTRCVRVCWHIEGAGTKNVSGRGSKATIITDLNQPWGASDTCTTCGKCVHVLPHRRSVPARAPRWPKWNRIATNSNSSSPHGRKNNGSLQSSHGLAGRLRRLPHVVPGPRRVAHRPRGRRRCRL